MNSPSLSADSQQIQEILHRDPSRSTRQTQQDGPSSRPRFSIMDDLKEGNSEKRQADEGLMSKYLRDLHLEEEKENERERQNQYKSRGEYRNGKKGGRKAEGNPNLNKESRKTSNKSDKLSGSRGSQLRQSWMHGSRQAHGLSRPPGIYIFTKKIDLNEPLEVWGEFQGKRSCFQKMRRSYQETSPSAQPPAKDLLFENALSRHKYKNSCRRRGLLNV